MDNDQLATLFVRSAQLRLTGQHDAASDLMRRAAVEMTAAPDDLTREIFGFLNGFAACLSLTGQSTEMLELLSGSKAGDDPDKMRSTIHDVLVAAA